jgi:DNA-binding transcriptional regulator YdaS (Cro superfamily)
MTPHPLDKAIAACDTQVALARRLGVSKSRISQWLGGWKVPMERCIDIEKKTRALAAERHDEALIVACEDLRPDVEWNVVRGNPRPHPAADPGKPA